MLFKFAIIELCYNYMMIKKDDTGMWKNKKNIRIMFLLALVMICIPFANAIAASKLNLYNYGTKQNLSYTGQQVKYYYNGAAINMRNTPGIIVDGVALASYKDIFIYSGMDVKYEYVKTKGTVTLSQNGKTIVFTIGSKKAYVNGKAVTIPAAPIKIYFKDKKLTKILVPTRFVTETFGSKYAWNSTSSSAFITSPMNLYYNNSTVSYTGTEGQVTIDGKKINLGYMPSIIVNTTAMLRAKTVFSSSSIGAEYDYNYSEKELTLTKGTNIVVLTLDSKTAIVNGISRVMNTAPIVVKNLDKGYSYIMVPGSYIASYLGYNYSWNSDSKSSIISTKKPVEDEEDGSDPLEDVVSFNWGIQNVSLDDYVKTNNIKNTTEISNDLDTISNVSSILKENSVDSNKETYSIHSETPFSKSTVAVQDKALTIHINKAVAENKSYYLGGSFVDVVTSINNPTDSTSDISFNLLYSNIKYELTLSEDRCTLYVTLYSNYLCNVTAGTKSGNDYILITGMNDLLVNLIENTDNITLQVPNTSNGIGENYEETSSLTSLKSVQITNATGNMVNIILTKSGKSEYYITQAGNTYMVTFIEDQIVDNLDYDLQIKLPTGVSYSYVQNEDRYYNHQFVIKIPGDYRSFYSNNPLSSSNNVVSKISVIYNNYNETEIIVSTTKLQGYKLEENNGYIGVTTGNPKDIYKNIVVLDAGHGGTDPGALRSLNGVTIYEKDINFSIIYSRTKKYFNAKDSDIKVYYSRYDNTKVDLYKRAAFAKEVGADLFVSLHMNANNGTSIRGTEIYYSDANNKISSMGLNSKTMAAIFLKYLPKAVGTTTRGIRSQAYVVVKYNTVPAILIELGFMSNNADLSLMTNASFQEKAAKSIYTTLETVFETYPTGR